ncbi:hypothetical protein Mic7113_4629 [Allocoleopsis franciscana PCC 7113]|uniref:Uncharacterized protein n=1 Tax=Allocoleopsis franciscana PCC 7113 TaxID=1173027 RepID=K9WKK6_9CYAN|nr:hypothetical protein Mic7113_4629 [Allocoleopsis franciscana PCC 7113]
MSCWLKCLVFWKLSGCKELFFHIYITKPIKFIMFVLIVHGVGVDLIPDKEFDKKEAALFAVSSDK